MHASATLARDRSEVGSGVVVKASLAIVHVSRWLDAESRHPATAIIARAPCILLSPCAAPWHEGLASAEASIVPERIASGLI